MACTVSHRESRVMLVELLLAEKDDTRVWLRTEMDRLLDPMLDSIFNRLETKLTNAIMERTKSGDDGCDCAQIGNPSFSNQSANVPQSATFIAQPSTSHLSSLNSTSFHLNPQYDESKLTSPISPVPRQTMSNSQITLSNELTNAQSRPIKDEFEENATVQPFVTSISFHLNQNALKSHDQTDEPICKDEQNEEQCDCNDCVYGGIEVKEEDDEDNDDDNSVGVQWIEDGQGYEEFSRPVKRPRMDSIQPNSSQQVELSLRQPIEQVQPIQMNNKPFITVHLRCPLSDCPHTFPEDQLNQHMLDVHSIGPNRCLLKDCGQAFDNSATLSGHIKQAHSGIDRWHCSKCPKNFSKYHVLFDHNIKYHQLGHFECTFPLCTFTGQHKMKMINHYAQQHKPELSCSHPGCNYRTYIASVLKNHERALLGIRPYRCKWPHCDYSSSYQQVVICHIRTHLARSDQSLNVAQSIDPKDYLEVASELLLQNRNQINIYSYHLSYDI